MEYHTEGYPFETRQNFPLGKKSQGIEAQPTSCYDQRFGSGNSWSHNDKITSPKFHNNCIF